MKKEILLKEGYVFKFDNCRNILHSLDYQTFPILKYRWQSLKILVPATKNDIGRANIHISDYIKFMIYAKLDNIIYLMILLHFSLEGVISMIWILKHDISEYLN